MDDDLITPMKHNRWAVIVPALAFAANVAGDVHSLFSSYTRIAAAHGMQRHYDDDFEEIVNGNPGIGSGADVPED